MIKIESPLALKAGLYLLLVVLVVGSGWWVLHSRYSAGLEAGRAECQADALQAQLQEQARRLEEAKVLAEVESARADAAYRTAGAREYQAAQVEAAAKSQSNAGDACINSEVADAIRSIR